MTSVRWLKVIRDLCLNKVRTGLVIAAVALGAFGVGAILNAYTILVREMNKNFLRTNPASVIFTIPTADSMLLQEVKSLPDVKDAELRKMVKARLLLKNGDWQSFLFFGVRDPRRLSTDTFRLEEGSFPQGSDEILIERAALGMTGASVDDKLQIKVPGKPLQTLKIAGTVHAPGLPPAWMENIVWGFATPATLKKMGDSGVLDKLRVVVRGERFSREHIGDAALRIKSWCEEHGYPVQQVEIPPPGKHPHASQMAALLFLLQCFGGLALVLSGVLVANMMNAVLAREIKQIGMMKSLGAQNAQIILIYLGLVLVPGVAALMLAMPAAVWIGRMYAAFASGMLNFTVMDNRIPLWSYVIQIVVGLLVPVAAAALPILRGCRITIKESLSENGTKREEFGAKRWGLLERVFSSNRAWLLALRNTFRRRGRLVLTTITLAAGGAILIVAINIFGSIEVSVDRTLQAQGYEARINFDGPYEINQLERVALSVPHVADVECWGGGKAVLEGARGLDSASFPIDAIPEHSHLLNLPLVQGRWLQPGDKNTLVINQGLRSKDPQFAIGGKVALRIGGQVSAWRIIGIVREMGSEPRAYASKAFFDQLFNESQQARTIVVGTRSRQQPSLQKLSFLQHFQHGSAPSASVVNENKPLLGILERRLEDHGFVVAQSEDVAGFRKVLEEHLKIIAVFLMLMSMLTVLIGGLGLASATGINVVERMREIGVMRSIGGTKAVIVGLFIKEGFITGMLSWLLSVVLSIPMTHLIGSSFGNIFFQAPLDLDFGHHGLVAWLALVGLITAIASFFAAQKATKLSIRDVLAYE